MFGDSGRPGMPVALRNLILLCAGVYVLDTLTRGAFFYRWLALDGSRVAAGQAWRLLTYAFLHDPASIWHIVFNMLMLWMFGTPVFEAMGTRRFLAMYLSGAVAAGILSLGFDQIAGPHIYIGASGAIFTVMVAFARFHPRAQILIFFLFPMEARWAVTLFMGIDLFMMISGAGGDIANITHLGGAAWAFAYFPLETYFLGMPARRRERNRRQIQWKVRTREDAVREAMERIDPILAKVSRTGMGSLTPEEKQILEIASAESRRKKEEIGRLGENNP